MEADERKRGEQKGSGGRLNVPLLFLDALVVAEVVPEKLKVGSYNGVVLLKTNDPQVPELRMPVTCRVSSDW